MRPGRFGRYAIRTADGVQEAAYLPIGGIEQYIRVRGRSRAEGGECPSYEEMRKDCPSHSDTGDDLRESQGQHRAPGPEWKYESFLH